jgi:hypothetical protein
LAPFALHPSRNNNLLKLIPTLIEWNIEWGEKIKEKQKSYDQKDKVIGSEEAQIFFP